jgi:hypothetical protein
VYDRVHWPELDQRITASWRQGEHVAVIAPTGRGKTVLINQLLPKRGHTVFFGTKMRDPEYDRLMRTQGFKRYKKWPAPPWVDKVMLWPSHARTISESMTVQQDVFGNALNHIFRQGKWTCVFDELHWLTNDLKLYREVASMHHQGRSNDLTLIDGFQRPAFVPVIVYSSATHVFCWGTNHRKDLSTLSSVAKLDRLSQRDLSTTMGTLGSHEFVYVNVRDQHDPIISQVSR